MFVKKKLPAVLGEGNYNSSSKYYKMSLHLDLSLRILTTIFFLMQIIIELGALVLHVKLYHGHLWYSWDYLLQ